LNRSGQTFENESPACMDLSQGRAVMIAFNARYVSFLKSDRLYRVYIERDELFFLKIAGQAISQALSMHFGLLGILIFAPMRRRAKTKIEARIKEYDQHPPSIHLSDGKHNFRTMISEIESSTLMPAAAFNAHGQQVGRWVLQIRGQKPMSFQFESLEDMRHAFEMLPKHLSVHQNQVVWNDAKGKYVKMK
jgi:hypothetical protein